MLRVIHFDIPADDLARAQKFYSSVFGWKFDKWDGPFEHWNAKTGEDNLPGINGGLMKRMPGQGIVNTIDVPSIEEFTKKIESNGGKIITQKEPIQGVGYLGRCLDTERNGFCIIEFDKNAK
jgi:predicted enzyme related to lactoylglutathione lyase